MDFAGPAGFSTRKHGSMEAYRLGNGPPRAVHLITAEERCAGLLRVDLEVRNGIRNRPVWWGFFLFLGAGSAFTQTVSPLGDECEAWSLPETGSPLTSSAPGLT